MINKFIPIKESYKEISHLIPNKILNYISKTLKLNSDINILDYGCGYGGIIKYLNTKDSNFNYYAIDIDKNAQDYCHKLYPERLKKRQTYDLILVIGVVELNTNKENEDIFDYIKKHSNSKTIIIITTDLFSLNNFRTLFYYFISLGNVSKYYKKYKYYKNEMSNKDLQRQIVNFGFNIIKIFPGPLFYPKSNVKKFITWLMHVNSSYGYVLKIK